MKKYLFIVLLLVITLPGKTFAQKVGLKTNVLYWATTTPNIGVEVKVAPRFTLNLEGGYNPWTLNDDVEVNKKIKHFLVSPEARYWFCEAFNGHFLGLNGNYTQFNIGAIDTPKIFYSLTKSSGFKGIDESTRNEGCAAGAGITYGYQWILGRRLNLEATIGLGYWYTEYNRYANRKCGIFQQELNHHLFGITKCGLSFIYLIK